MSHQLVSVIIPNYNHARYLDERIQSVLSQTYQNFELIILDDCSPDHGASKAIIEKYRTNPHVSHIVYNEINSGSTFKQWHKGMELAKGELIWIAESDDKCEVNLLETLVNQFSINQQCVLAYCISVLFDDSGQVLGYSGKSGEDIQMSGDDFIRDYMCNGNAIWNASSALFKREVALSINKQYDTYRGAGDRLFWIEMAEQGHVSIVKKKLNYSRRHPNNSTKRFYATGINQKEDKLILDYIYKQGHISTKSYFWHRIKYSNSRILFWKFENKQIKEDVIKFWQLNTFDILCIYLYHLCLYLFCVLSDKYCRWIKR